MIFTCPSCIAHLLPFCRITPLRKLGLLFSGGNGFGLPNLAGPSKITLGYSVTILLLRFRLKTKTNPFSESCFIKLQGDGQWQKY